MSRDEQVVRPDHPTPDPEVQVVNPIVLVEVTSTSSRAYDRGTKPEHYRQIPSLREVVLVAHDVQQVEVWRRQDEGSWLSERIGPDGTARLLSIACELRVADIYLNPLA